MQYTMLKILEKNNICRVLYTKSIALIFLYVEQDVNFTWQSMVLKI